MQSREPRALNTHWTTHGTTHRIFSELARSVALLCLWTAGFNIQLALSSDQNPKCHELLTDPKPTHELIGYLNDLLERQIIGDAELVRFYKNLEQGLLENPIDEQDAATKSSLLIHSEGIAQKLKAKPLHLEELKKWARNAIKNKAAVQIERDDVRSQTQSAKIQLKPAVVPGRTFRMVGAPVEVELSHTIEVMATPFTQEEWVELFGVNPSHFQNGPYTVVKMIGGKQVKMQPQNPVENITYWSALVAANKLSEKKGFKPAYDLSAMKWDPATRAEDGSLKPKSGQVHFHGPGNDIYLTQGYRLATEAELDYLFLLERAQNGQAAVTARAWISDNSNGSTHPVAELMPFSVQGIEIYDIIGNVDQWGHDWLGVLKPQKDPAGERDGTYRPTTRGTWSSSSLTISNPSRELFDSSYRTNYCGVRFVRTLK